MSQPPRWDKTRSPWNRSRPWRRRPRNKTLLPLRTKRTSFKPRKEIVSRLFVPFLWLWLSRSMLILVLPLYIYPCHYFIFVIILSFHFILSYIPLSWYYPPTIHPAVRHPGIRRLPPRRTGRQAPRRAKPKPRRTFIVTPLEGPRTSILRGPE